MPKITVVGSINMDLVTRVDHMPREGETLHGESFRMVPGGKGANQAVCAARLGATVRMIGCLGQDAFADQLRSALEEAHVDTRGVQAEAGPSGTAVITVSRSGANTIVVVPAANEALQPESLEQHRAALREASVVLTQLETPLATAARLGALTREFGIPLILDPAPAQSLPAELLANITWLTPNETEACALLRSLGLPWGDDLPNDSLAYAARAFLERGVSNVVLKLGARGVFVMGRDVEPTALPAFEVEVKDTTAAGDAFNGGLAYALSEGALDTVGAARFACAVAAVSVTRPGAQPSMPALAEVQEILNR